jgi:uncharacterized membrane protein HdeD (DUF308 family)
MPLSDEERKRLEELERDLAAEDPKLAQELETGPTPRVRTAHITLGLLTAIIGVAVLILGVMSQLTLLGVAGFLLMCAGTIWILSTWGPRAARPHGDRDDRS